MNENNNQEIIQQLCGNLNTSNSIMVSSIARTNDPTVNERRYKIARVVTETTDQKRKIVVNSVVAAASLASFIGCSLIAANNLGIVISPEEMQTVSENIGNMLSSMNGIETIADEIAVNIGTAEELSKEIFTLDNVKSYFSELGVVGYVSGILSLVKTRTVGKNLQKINTLNKEFKSMDAVYPEDCDIVRRSLADRSRERVRCFVNGFKDGANIIIEPITKTVKDIYKFMRTDSKMKKEAMEELCTHETLDEYIEGRSK